VFRWHGANLTTDHAPYYEELAAAGFPLPPRPLAAALKALLLPLTVLEYKRRLRRWRALWPELLAGPAPAGEAPPAPPRQPAR
jgi:hypothetical protein